ncbi:GNAT family N-acetyltransferase [Ottowia testudinis]|uniref:GNAT family N-acetyltransferase n=1 Tax=Ottowia testudinis TaxID=2816950 RepID=A0A975CHB7_9BURK|nr:N-acetyltransferase [Ottowia testudinis]QTD44189.1 GNAT family N-acetyltransferase [Ottowia testudinis]
MPADVTIRLLTDTDLSAYKALRDVGLQHDPEAFTSDFDTASALPPATYATRLGQPPDDHFILGAFDASGAMLGAVVCERQARLKKRHEAELVGMIIAPEARSRGIGKALLKEFDTLVRQLPGLEQVVLSVTASNAAAVRLYEGAGFVRYGLQPRATQVDGVYHDKAWMMKQL